MGNPENELNLEEIESRVNFLSSLLLSITIDCIFHFLPRSVSVR